jgi:hypothetical protein
MDRGVESLNAALSSIEKVSLLLNEAQGSEVPIRVNPQLMGQMVFGKTLHQVTMRLLRLVAVSRQYMPPSTRPAAAEGPNSNAGHDALDIQYGADGGQPSFLIERIFCAKRLQRYAHSKS